MHGGNRRRLYGDAPLVQLRKRRIIGRRGAVQVKRRRAPLGDQHRLMDRGRRDTQHTQSLAAEFVAMAVRTVEH